ncbi:MAG: recombination mediator RecR [Proteobacteria bacterium]|nr:recombination mediator RecR [Pseudomonadota bacterium]
MYCPQPMLHLIQCLSALPGIGEKTATRLALYIMNQTEADALQLARSILEVKEKVHLCSRCFNFADSVECAICRNPSRDAHLLCVVETPGDLMAIEKAGHYKGLYHVLHGAIAPLDGVGPDQLKIKELLQRVSAEAMQEIILATNPTVSGNASALYISQQLISAGVRITRIAQGVPSGGDIEYIDEGTLRSAFDGRREMK